jgi:hypothetical protein
MARIDLSGRQIPTLSKLNIDGEFTLDAQSGTSGQVLTSAGAGATPIWTTPTGTDTNYYPSAIVFNAGTTSGPTLDLTMSGSGAPDLTAVAIPSAGASASGVITTNAQSFTGRKTFLSGLSVNGSASTIELGGDPGAAGYILTSQGGSTLPIWTSRNSPTFIVRKTATQVIGASSNTIVNFNTSGSVVANTGSAYSMSGGRVTVPNTGKYRIKGTAYWDAAVTTGNNKVVFLYINASPATRMNAYGGLTYDFISETGIEEVELTSGDIVDMRVYQTSPSNVSLLSAGSSQLYAYGTSLMIQYKGA